MYTFLLKKKINFLSNSFKVVRSTLLINIFGSNSRILTQQNSRLVFSSNSFAHVVYIYLFQLKHIYIYSSSLQTKHIYIACTNDIM